MSDYTLPDIDWTMIAPVILVMVAGIIGLMIRMFAPKSGNTAVIGVSLFGLAVAAGNLFGQLSAPDAETLAQMVIRDHLAVLLQLGLVVVGLFTVMISEGYLEEKKIAYGEFYPLVLWSLAGGMIMVSTSSLLMLFIGLEVLSIALYVLAGLSRKEQKSEESAIKYFLLGAFASGFLLYGIAFIYGATGSVHLSAISIAWSQNSVMTQNLLLFGVGLILVGLSFKSAFVPFHQWTPDVYQGAPTNVTGFMAAGSKIAAIGALYRVMDNALPMKEVWLPVLIAISILTMTVGNILACVQKDVKRILGYSSIANAGYILAAICAHLKDPAKVDDRSVVFYLFSYALMTVGAFAVISAAAKHGEESTTLAGMNGLWKRAPLVAGTLILFVASLIGIPPTAGFFGKLFIFQDLQSVGLMGLAIALALNSIVSVYYYLAIVHAAVVSDAEPEKPSLINPMLAGVCALCAVGVVFMGLMNSPVIDMISGVAR